MTARKAGTPQSTSWTRTADPERPRSTNADVVLGIDAGGTRMRARAVVGTQVVFEGRGGPGNPLMVAQETLSASYDAALRGCPEPSRVGACVAGTRDAEARDRVVRLLRGHFPAAELHVVPDYVATFHAAPDETDVCVIAGTGSLICSYTAGAYSLSGGYGWILGDHGGASRLGRAALEWIADNPACLGSRDLGGEIEALFSTRDMRRLVTLLHSSPAPAEFLARAAVTLTRRAEDGELWAVERLTHEMTLLARDVGAHVAAHFSDRPQVSVALSGGVWSSSAATGIFVDRLAKACPAAVSVARSRHEPIVGAVRFASSIPAVR